VIEDYALLGDCQGAALVSRAGSVDWWSPRRFDAPSVFARLLDPDAGHFSLRPAAPADASRRYLDDTMVLETTFTTASGVVRVTDALAFARGARGHQIGHGVPHALARVVDGVAGTVELEVEFVPRPEYGLAIPSVLPWRRGVRTAGGPRTLYLACGRPLRPEGTRAGGRFTLRAGESAGFVLHDAGALFGPEPEPLEARAAVDDAAAGWRSWVGEHGYDDLAYADAVRRSALVLQALTYQPTGAIVAAPTTSLPEVPGGRANWDYRYAWLRDAAFTVRALREAACADEAERYFEWIVGAASGCSHQDTQIVFGVEGERDLTEHELPHLAGYRGARPVRVGNDAWRQRQLDVPGEVLDAACILRDGGEPFDRHTASFLAGLADTAAASWREPDSGIWEGREGERHFVPSKLMCWVALDRAVRLTPQLDGAARAAAWRRERDAVAAAIRGEGWHEGRGAYTGAFGSDHLDVAVLMMPLVGLLPAGDERMRRTVACLRAELGDGALLRRWTGAVDGAFLLASFWLATWEAQTGRPDRAREVVEEVLACASDVGLLAEEVWPPDRSALGNYPQALSHVGLVNAATAITEAERGRRDAG
jgi:GH15 family glucan-1,4-alpha-glucosidase